ncbi:hypothetical protein KIW84_024965 [Lathyrus oleraceus]|uniref:GPI ethanolamine phosphate transferase 1 n=1 Tax=Pisum sativum TaxID=3888 RepID=A0A9D5BCR7_PEA|nr:hypothetical protein KIW84_024964 [Pisum sativum]KAI5439386.1 hypothetical protein KIW84_024965 [Pisum sativum]
MDLWSLDKFQSLLNQSNEDPKLKKLLQQDNLVVFLHLLGCDSNGHAHRPFSSIYLDNVKQMVNERRTPLMVAATYGSIDIMKPIISLFDVDINRICGLDKNTALHCAASVGVENDVDDVAAQDSVTKFSENMAGTWPAECVYTFLDRSVATPSLFEISSDLLADDVSHILEKKVLSNQACIPRMLLQLSTGLPKGVTITHGNIVATEAAVMTVIPNLGSKDVCLAYLLLAHVFEIAAESVMLAAGVAIGYATLMTLTGTSNKIKKGFTNQSHK